MYRYRSESLIDLYKSWAIQSKHKTDMINAAKEQIQSVANIYTHDEFITNRDTINKHFGYNIGKVFKEEYYVEVNLKN